VNRNKNLENNIIEHNNNAYKISLVTVKLVPHSAMKMKANIKLGQSRGPVKFTSSSSIGFTKLESSGLSINSEISSFVLTWLFVEKYP